MFHTDNVVKLALFLWVLVLNSSGLLRTPQYVDLGCIHFPGHYEPQLIRGQMIMGSKPIRNTRKLQRSGNAVRSQHNGNEKNQDSWKVLTTKFDSMKERSDRFGKLKKVDESNSGIDELKCRHFGSCAGCAVNQNFHLTPITKRAIQFFKATDTEFNIHSGKITGWRTHVKLAVQPLSKWGGLRFGLFKSGTHAVEPIPDCKVHHPRINYAIEQLRLAAIDAGVRGYIEAAPGLDSQGDLRYIQLSMDRVTGKVQLVLVWNALTYKDTAQSLPRLVKRLKARADIWHSVTVNFQPSLNNAIFNLSPKAWKTVWGPPLLKETVANATFYFQPQIFRQANLDEFERSIIPLVVNSVPPGSVVAELYSGIGLIGLNLAGRATEVFCSDSNVYVDSVFDKCADSLPEAERDNVFFECLDAEEAILQGQCDEANVLIVDPPRKGLDAGVLQMLTGNHPEGIEAPELQRLIYISCGFEALERDIRVLIGSEQWTVVSADGVILFPGSDHVESVVVLDKVLNT